MSRSLHISLSDSEQRQVADFLRIVRDLCKTALFRDGPFDFHYSIKSPNGSQAIRRIDGPSDDHIKLALYDIRCLWAQREHTNIHKIHNIVNSKIADPNAQSELGQIYSSYKDTMSKGPDNISILSPNSGGSPRRTPHEAIDLYFNGEYFHKEIEKRDKLLVEYYSIAPEMRFLFLYGIRELFRHALALASLLHRHLGY